MVLASNPGGEAHLWLVSRFITKKVDPKEDGNYKPDDYVFIQSLVGDNAYNDAFYVDRLRSMSEADREAFLFGNMDAFAGQYFREWSRPAHHHEGSPFGYGAPGERGIQLARGLVRDRGRHGLGLLAVARDRAVGLRSIPSAGRPVTRSSYSESSPATSPADRRSRAPRRRSSA
jgi:hypothetical protein